MAKLNYHSVRAKKARLGRQLSGGVRAGAAALTVTLFLFGVGLLVMGSAIGWVLIGLGAFPSMLLLWYRYDLMSVAVGGGSDLDQILDGVVLGAIPAQPSPRQIAEAAMRTQSGRFMTVRLGLSARFVIESSSETHTESQMVWDHADRLRQAAGDAEIGGNALIAALCHTQPALRAILPQLQLGLDDLEKASQWYSRIAALIEEQSAFKKTGGVARDWAFGYANLLEQFGYSVSDQVARGGLLHVRLDSHGVVLEQLRAVFGANGRRNVSLIGPLGAGKTTIVHAFAESLLEGGRAKHKELAYNKILGLNASAIISAAQNRSELEGLVNHLFVEAYRAKNIILFLDDAQLFFEDGNGSVDLSSILLPVLDGGNLKLIVAMDEQAYLRISQRNPAVAGVMNRVTVPPATEDETLLVLQDQAIQVESRQNVTCMYQALREAYRLSERYMRDVAQPGKAMRLLEQAARFPENGFVTPNSVAASIEQSTGVKVGRAEGEVERGQLLQLEDMIHERMVNQTRAVSVVSDALRRARAGVRNEKKPIGTFLFLGPTGVGKTELAKALAAVYFGGEDRLVRLDLNEFVRPEDVSRLIADGSQDPHSLTASISKQPFSVVLLDEVEKAHPQVLTTLLQMLDEGILRDIQNREISFREAIIIATSNAGADKIRDLVTQGKQLADFEGQLVDELIDAQQFRPEFLNRFDEIVVFGPLNKPELMQVVSRMIDGVNTTLAPQKISVQLDELAIAKLADIGYDPRLGARPMRRMVQRSVENLVAKRLLSGEVAAGQTIMITEADIESSAQRPGDASRIIPGEIEQGSEMHPR